MRIASEMLAALAVLNIDESSLTETVTPVATQETSTAMATLNHSDMNPTTIGHKVNRPFRKMFTTALIAEMVDGDELAADEAWYRLRHRDTLKPHNARRLQHALDAFREAVPGYLDPEAMAQAIKDAQDLSDVDVEPEPEPERTPALVRSEDAELRSQVWALTIAVQQLAERLESLA